MPLGSAWQKDSLVEDPLDDEDASVDLFAILLARMALKRIAAEIPTYLDVRAKYWAEHWKTVFNPELDRPKKIKQFKDNAAHFDGHL